MFRFITMVLFLAFIYIISLPQFIYHSIRKKTHPQESAKSSQHFVVWVLRILTRMTGSKITVLGLENVPEDGPVLYVGNHRSIFDIVIGYCYVKNNTGFVAKDSLEKTPLVGQWMKYLNCLFLNRTDIKQGLKTILRGIELVKEGTSIFIFPEGTRSEEDTLLPFKEGSLKIAEKSGCPIVPVAITGTEKIFEQHFPKVRPSTVVFEFGKPIDLKLLDKETKRHSGAYVRDIIIQMREKHQSMITSGTSK